MQLAEVEDCLVLADGTKIGPDGKVVREQSNAYIEVPNNSEAQRIIARTRRTVSDLPLPPAQLSSVALVSFYTLFGLSDRDISVALEAQLTVEQIINIRELDVYKDYMQVAKENILNSDTNNVRDIFQQHATSAARKIIKLANSDNDVLSFKASQDLLDRAGHRPVDIVEHKHSMDGNALRIVHEHHHADVDVPMLNVTPNQLETE